MPSSRRARPSWCAAAAVPTHQHSFKSVVGSHSSLLLFRFSSSVLALLLLHQPFPCFAASFWSSFSPTAGSVDTAVRHQTQKEPFFTAFGDQLRPHVDSPAAVPAALSVGLDSQLRGLVTKQTSLPYSPSSSIATTYGRGESPLAAFTTAAFHQGQRKKFSISPHFCDAARVFHRSCDSGYSSSSSDDSRSSAGQSVIEYGDVAERRDNCTFGHEEFASGKNGKEGDRLSRPEEEDEHCNERHGGPCHDQEEITNDVAANQNLELEANGGHGNYPPIGTQHRSKRLQHPPASPSDDHYSLTSSASEQVFLSSSPASGSSRQETTGPLELTTSTSSASFVGGSRDDNESDDTGMGEGTGTGYYGNENEKQSDLRASSSRSSAMSPRRASMWSSPRRALNRRTRRLERSILRDSINHRGCNVMTRDWKKVFQLFNLLKIGSCAEEKQIEQEKGDDRDLHPVGVEGILGANEDSVGESKAHNQEQDHQRIQPQSLESEQTTPQEIFVKSQPAPVHAPDTPSTFSSSIASATLPRGPEMFTIFGGSSSSGGGEEGSNVSSVACSPPAPASSVSSLAGASSCRYNPGSSSSCVSSSLGSRQSSMTEPGESVMLVPMNRSNSCNTSNTRSHCSGSENHAGPPRRQKSNGDAASSSPPTVCRSNLQEGKRIPLVPKSSKRSADHFAASKPVGPPDRFGAVLGPARRWKPKEQEQPRQVSAASAASGSTSTTRAPALEESANSFHVQDEAEDHPESPSAVDEELAPSCSTPTTTAIIENQPQLRPEHDDQSQVVPDPACHDLLIPRTTPPDSAKIYYDESVSLFSPSPVCLKIRRSGTMLRSCTESCAYSPDNDFHSFLENAQHGRKATLLRQKLNSFRRARSEEAGLRCDVRGLRGSFSSNADSSSSNHARTIFSEDDTTTGEHQHDVVVRNQRHPPRAFWSATPTAHALPQISTDGFDPEEGTAHASPGQNESSSSSRRSTPASTTIARSSAAVQGAGSAEQHVQQQQRAVVVASKNQEGLVPLLSPEDEDVKAPPPGAFSSNTLPSSTAPALLEAESSAPRLTAEDTSTRSTSSSRQAIFTSAAQTSNTIPIVHDMSTPMHVDQDVERIQLLKKRRKEQLENLQLDHDELYDLVPWHLVSTIHSKGSPSVTPPEHGGSSATASWAGDHEVLSTIGGAGISVGVEQERGRATGDANQAQQLGGSGGGAAAASASGAAGGGATTSVDVRDGGEDDDARSASSRVA
ncbi:unnamed protein product [Amoebophrya sp. A120]|nr:unnamed protein product [Amoebophrya sp. A120]|eukprot:GSA120T00009628001.1